MNAPPIGLKGATMAVSGGGNADTLPARKTHYIDVALPDSIDASQLFVAFKPVSYFPGAAGATKVIFGAPPRIKVMKPPVKLPVPSLRIPPAPAVSTTPGPALEGAARLPRAGVPIEEWKGAP